MSVNTTNFAEVYRAAFAERDPNRKLALLGEVQRAIRSWEQDDETASAPNPKLRPQLVSPHTERASAA